MNKFIAMVILKPDIKEERINYVQSGIINLFEQNTKVQKVWYLGKRKLDFKSKKYTEGIYIKLDILGRSKKIEQIRAELRRNQDIISSIIMNNESEIKSRLSSLRMRRLPFYNNIPIHNTTPINNSRKIYMLINKNIKVPFNDSDIIAMSENENRILETANKKLYEYIFMKGYRTLKHFKIIKEVEKELKNNRKVQFVFDNNPNIGQELIIQERYLT